MSSIALIQLLNVAPQIIVLLVGIVLFGVRRRRIGPPATFAIIGFVLHLVAYVVTALTTYLSSEIRGSGTDLLITINVAVTVIRLVGYVLLIIAIVRFARSGFGATPPALGFGSYPPGPGHTPYAAAPGAAPYPQASSGPGQYPQATPMAPPQAHPGQEQGELLRSAVGELNELGRFGTLARNGQWNPRVRELGQLLDRSGGIYAMKEAHMQVARAVPHVGQELDTAWNGIGNWQGRTG